MRTRWKLVTLLAASAAAVASLVATGPAAHAAPAFTRAPGDAAAPVAAYNLDNSTADATGNGNPITWKGTASYGPGVSGQAALTSNDTNFLVMPTTAQTTPSTTSHFSVAFWINETKATSDANIMGNSNAASCNNAGFDIYNESGTTFPRFCVGNTVGGTKEYQMFSSTVSLTSGWHYLALTYAGTASSGGTFTGYFDGQQAFTQTVAAGANITGYGAPVFGFDGSQKDSADGYINAGFDDIDYYNQTISAAQVAADYAMTAPPAAAFVTPYYTTVAAQEGEAFHTALAGLWTGSTPAKFTKVSGDDWITLNSDGSISGTAPSPAPDLPGSITVKATAGSSSDTITVSVPVLPAGAQPQITAASWNVWDNGSHVSNGLTKELAAITGSGLDLVGLQGTLGTGAQQLAAALGWNYYQSSGDLGLISPYAISDVTAPTSATPAVGLTLHVDGENIRVWDAHLDESNYGPTLACDSGYTADQLAASEQGSTRYAQAQAIATEMAPDIAAEATTPVILLGDLASPSSQDWTDGTASSDCNVGATDWPVPDVFKAAGLTDSLRAAYPDPTQNPADTYSLVGDAPSADTPQQRVDYVDNTGGLSVIDSEAYYLGWPANVPDQVSNEWPSDHAAAVTYYQMSVPPIVTLSVSPAAPDGNSGWYTSAPTLTATATAAQSSGTTTIHYSTDGGVTWRPYTGPVTAPDGVSSYEVQATDQAGNVSETVTVPVSVDTTAPVTTAATEPGDTIITPIAVTLNSSDATSGVASTQYSTDGGTTWKDYTGVFTVTPTTADQAIKYRSTDVAGNVEQAKSLVIPAITPVTPTVTATAAATQFGTAGKATVTVSSPGLPATGTVTLAEGSAVLGTATSLAADGSATFTLPVGLSAGTHTLTASYSGSDLLTPASQTFTVTVNLPAAWSAKSVYQAGALVGYQGSMYKATYYSQNQAPGDPNGPWQEIQLEEDGTAVWTASRIFQAGDIAVYNGKTFKASYYTRNQKPGDPNGPWQEQAQAGPNGIAPWTPTTIYTAGDMVIYNGNTYTAQYYTRNQAPGNPSGPWRLTS
jgi:hypothetical protein